MPLPRGHGHERRDPALSPHHHQQQRDGRSGSSSVVVVVGPACRQRRRRRQQRCGIARLGAASCHDLIKEVAATGGGCRHGHQHLRRQGPSEDSNDDDEARSGVQRQHQERADKQIQPPAELVALTMNRLLQLSITCSLINSFILF
jgi:hypothetical protein